MNRVLACFAVVSAFGLAVATEARADEVAPYARALFGDRGVHVIADGTVVEVARIQSTRGERTYSIGHAYVIRPEFGREFARQILDPHTYPVPEPSSVSCEGKGPCGEGTIKLCGGFDPGVVVRFHGPHGGMVDALLCFNCDDIGAVPRPSNRMPLERQSRYVVPRKVDTADMERGALLLLGLADRAFPGDPDLRDALERAKRHAAEDKTRAERESAATTVVPKGFDTSLLQILACPENLTKLRLATGTELETIRAKVATGGVRYRDGRAASAAFDGLLIRADARVGYVIKDGIADLRVDDGLALDPSVGRADPARYRR
jgi:uncharacterized protein YbaR (Trm112 family)